MRSKGIAGKYLHVLSSNPIVHIKLLFLENFPWRYANKLHEEQELVHYFYYFSN